MFYAVWRTLTLLRALFYSLESRLTVVRYLQRHAHRRPDIPYLLYGDERFTYGEANAIINRHAHAYSALGIGRGDVVALIVDNRPAYLWHLFGLHKIGAVASLINVNLSGEVLAHAIRVCGAKRVLVGSEHWAQFDATRSLLPSDLPFDVDIDPAGSAPEGVSSWATRLEGAADTDPEDERGPMLKDLAAFIYTSGTTGLPKAALIKHHRLFRAGAAWFGLAVRYRRGDVLYNCLPLYHSNGILLGTGSVTVAGATMALGRKFSRSRFWDDVRRYHATAFIYIGELCRYLMNSPPDARDGEHELRVVTGNGLRPDIWPQFQERFRIPRVAEFYGSTEGNVITVNLRGEVGSVGPVTPGMVLVKWDEDAQQPVRDANGFFIRVPRGETGLLLGKHRSRMPFDGYQDKKASERKLLRDCFKKGDAYFDTGDLMRTDKRNNLFFVDRVGDTFRWKGENVSTTEVQEQLASWPPAAEVNVYGVNVPHMEGRAGMAAVVMGDTESFDSVRFKEHVDGRLPRYARPLFVRVSRALETTATMKLKKTELQEQGFDPTSITEPLFVRHPEHDEYVPVDGDIYDLIRDGKLKL
jgi:acyl-CoA synthetase (AMP-forming)/AMP-acid ligase II